MVHICVGHLFVSKDVNDVKFISVQRTENVLLYIQLSSPCSPCTSIVCAHIHQVKMELFRCPSYSNYSLSVRLFARVFSKFVSFSPTATTLMDQRQPKKKSRTSELEWKRYEIIPQRASFALHVYCEIDDCLQIDYGFRLFRKKKLQILCGASRLRTTLRRFIFHSPLWHQLQQTQTIATTNHCKYARNLCLVNRIQHFLHLSRTVSMWFRVWHSEYVCNIVYVDRGSYVCADNVPSASRY